MCVTFSSPLFPSAESTNLKNPSLSSSSPFSTRVHIFYASELASVQRLVSLDSTEVVEVSSKPATLGLHMYMCIIFSHR